MAVEFNVDPELSVIILRAINPVRLPDDPNQLIEAVVAFKNTMGGRVFRLFDASTADWMITDMMATIAIETGQPGTADDPDVTTMIVASDAFDQEGRDWLLDRIDRYQLDVHLFYSINDALDFAEQAVY